MRRASIFGIVGIVLLTIFPSSAAQVSPLRLTSLSPAAVPSCSSSCYVMRLTITGQNFPPNQNLYVYAGYAPGSTEFSLLKDESSSTSVEVFLYEPQLRVPGVLYITIYSSPAVFSNSLPLLVVSGPVLTGMIPSVAAPGATFIARINGSRLSLLQSVNFSGAGISARLLPDVEDWMRFAEVTVASSVTPGSYAITVSDSGRTTSFANLLTVRPVQATTTPSSRPLPIPDVENGPIKTGYVIVTADGPAFADPLVSMNVGIVRDGVVQSQAAIPGAAGATTRATLGIDIDPDLGRDFGIAILNTSKGPNSVHLTVVDERGVSISQTKTISLGEFNQISSFVSELLPSGALGTSFRGSLIVSNSQVEPFILLGLRFNGPYFFPVSAESGTSEISSPVKTSMIGGNRAKVTAFPQFALGGGWATQISIVDTKGVSATGRIAWFDKAGQPTNVTMNGETASVFQYTVPPNGSFLLAPRDAHGQTPF